MLRNHPGHWRERTIRAWDPRDLRGHRIHHHFAVGPGDIAELHAGRTGTHPLHVDYALDRIVSFVHLHVNSGVAAERGDGLGAGHLAVDGALDFLGDYRPLAI